MTEEKSTADAAVEHDAKGEGNCAAAREYQDAQHLFTADKDKVAKGARQAADALDGPEGAALESARAETAKR